MSLPQTLRVFTSKNQRKFHQNDNITLRDEQSVFWGAEGISPESVTASEWALTLDTDADKGIMVFSRRRGQRKGAAEAFSVRQVGAYP